MSTVPQEGAKLNDQDDEENADELPTNFANDGLEKEANDSFVPIEVSSDSDPHVKNALNDAHQDNQVSDESMEKDQILSLTDQYEEFQQSQKPTQVTLKINESDINLLPPTLRKPIRNLIKTLKRWLDREPSDEVLHQIHILLTLLNEFLELQHYRSDKNYDSNCTELLKQILQKNIEAQRLSRVLRSASEPRSLDEYMY